jgi:hypothetical protein
VPTSVLLAILAAAGLLALAPALTRRYDATERVAAERATSTARVLSRRRRRRTVPGARPINPPRFRLYTTVDTPSVGAPSVGARYASAPSRARRRHAVLPSRRTPSPSRLASSVRRGSSSRVGSSSRGSSFRLGSSSRRPAPSGRPLATALHRRRRVLVALVLLNLVELAGVLLVGPGFWIGFSVAFTVLLADLIYLRRRAVVAARRRRARQRRLAWVAAEQAAVRREHDRRALARESALRRFAIEREHARREAARQSRDYVERYTPRSS